MGVERREKEKCWTTKSITVKIGEKCKNVRGIQKRRAKTETNDVQGTIGNSQNSQLKIVRNQEINQVKGGRVGTRKKE